MSTWAGEVGINARSSFMFAMGTFASAVMLTTRFLDMVLVSPHLLSDDGVIAGRGHGIPSLEWLTDEGRALVKERLGLECPSG